MSNQIPGSLKNSRDPNCVAARAICIIDSLLPSKGRIQPPEGHSEQVRWVLTHSALEPKMKAMGKSKARVAAAFWANSELQILVPLLGDEIGLTQPDRNDDPYIRITTVEQLVEIALKIADKMPY